MDNLVPTLFAVSGLLALVSLLPGLARRLGLPYTVLLAVVGVVLGAIVHVARTQFGVDGPVMDGSGDTWPFRDFLAALGDLNLTSSVFLYVFLPVLLFETALAVDIRRLLDDLAPIMLLAVVAVLITTAVAGGAMWGAWWLWTGVWSQKALIVCLLMAAVVATTDPAAVVGIFRDIGAPRRLSILVEGESLFNDAAAIVLFALLLGLLTGGAGAHGAAPEGPIGAILDFIVKFVGGLALGWLMGRAAMWLIGFARGFPHAEATVTVALAYLAFIVAEAYAGVSGVVAVVTAGLVAASIGRTRVSPESWGTLRGVWDQLGFWAGSLIFLLASMLVPATLVEAEMRHGLLLLALIVAALVARGIVIFGLLPMLSWVGAADRISHRYKTVMLWGGLRGAVSLALGLAVTENDAVSQAHRDTVGVVVTGFVLFTLLIQGTTLRPLIRWLGIDRLSPADLMLRNRALGLSLGDVRREVEATARDFGIKAEPAVQPLLDRGAELAQEQLDLDAQYGGLTREDRVYVGLSTLARREEELYLEFFRDGIVSRLSVQGLAAQAGRLQDAVKTGRRQGYETAWHAALRHDRDLRLSLALHRRLGWAGPLGRQLAEQVARLLAQRLAVRALGQFVHDRLAPMLGRDAGAELEDLLGRRAKEVEHALEALRRQYPAYYEAVQFRYLARAGLRFEERSLRRLYEESLIGGEILHHLERDLLARRRVAEHPPELDLGLTATELVGRVHLFRGLERERLRHIEKLCRPLLAVPGEVLVRRGSKGDEMFIIESGAVSVHLPGAAEPVILGSGDVFGEMALLFEQPRNADVVSDAFSRLLVLTRRDFRRLMEADAGLRDHLERLAGRRLPGATTPDPPPEP